MASFRAIAAVSNSIVKLLDAGLRSEPPFNAADGATPTIHVVLVRTDDFDRSVSHAIQEPALSVYLYRVEPNRTMRAAWAGVGAHTGRVHTALDLHYLLTAWADNAEHEQRILGRAIQWLDTHPTLTGPLLDPIAGAASAEAVQLTLDDVAGETMFRVFELLPGKYRVSVPYVARVVRIDGADPRVAPPVLEAVSGLRGGVGAP